MKVMRIAVLALLLGGLLLTGCAGAQKNYPTYPLGTKDPGNLLTTTASINNVPVLSSVFVTVFGDTALLAVTPVMEYGELEMVGEPRDITQGGRIGLRDEDGNPVVITKVVIQSPLTPRSMKDWFRDLPELVAIQGLELICTDYVTDMSHAFSGCGKLSSINADSWNVEKVTDMTSIFEGCDSLKTKPIWYQES